jgi:hypothetical protein
MFATGKQQPEQVITGMTVNPGDSITASVQYISSGSDAGQYYLSIVDNTLNEYFGAYESSSQLQSPTAQRSTAEWIVEATTVGGKNATPPNFGLVTFTNASAVINGVSGPINSGSWQSLALNIPQSGVNYDSTAVLTNSETSFVVSYTSSATPLVISSTSAGAKTQSATAAPANFAVAKKLSSPVNATYSWIGASDGSRFRTPVRQLRRGGQLSSIDHTQN